MIPCEVRISALPQLASPGYAACVGKGKEGKISQGKGEGAQSKCGRGFVEVCGGLWGFVGVGLSLTTRVLRLSHLFCATPPLFDSAAT